jgi:hypothetical protein
MIQVQIWIEPFHSVRMKSYYVWRKTWNLNNLYLCLKDLTIPNGLFYSDVLWQRIEILLFDHSSLFAYVHLL